MGRNTIGRHTSMWSVRSLKLLNPEQKLTLDWIMEIFDQTTGAFIRNKKTTQRFSSKLGKGQV